MVRKEQEYDIISVFYMVIVIPERRKRMTEKKGVRSMAGKERESSMLLTVTKRLGCYKSARMGNVCGAIVVTKHGCANFMPTYEEGMAFVVCKKENIEQLVATRCFPEGRKNLSLNFLFIGSTASAL